jgi:hypothetical protein
MMAKMNIRALAALALVASCSAFGTPAFVGKNTCRLSMSSVADAPAGTDLKIR